MDRPPADHATPDPIPREPACHLCGPHAHHVLKCERCDCAHDIAPGEDD